MSINLPGVSQRRAWALLLGLGLLPGGAWAYQNYDPKDPPRGGPHRRINEYAFQVFVETRITQADKPDPILERYRFKDKDFKDLRALKGETISKIGDWPDDITVAEVELPFPQWIIEGGYTADEPELFMCLRHFYDPTQREGQRHLTDIPWIAEFREQVRKYWRKDVAIVNPQVDARELALHQADNRYSWDAGVASMRAALGPGGATQQERDQDAAQAWRALGETMHLLADMTTPAHVRNDGHPAKLPAGELRPDPYESYVLAPEVDAAYRSIPRTAWQRLDLAAAMENVISDAIADSKDPSSLFHTIAAYTNRNFFSSDTVQGTDHRGNAIPLINERNYPLPKLKPKKVASTDCFWDEDSGTYERGFPNRGTISLVKETEMSSTWGSWWRQIGIGIAGGTLTFSTTHDCAVSQAKVLVPIAIAGNVRLVDWFVPRIAITLQKIGVGEPDQPIRGTVTHRPYGAYTQPIEVTLAKDARAYLFVDGVPQKSQDYELSVVQGELSGKLRNIDLSKAKRVWVELDLAGMQIASDEYNLAGTGTIIGRVLKTEDEVKADGINVHNPFFDGVPLPGVQVVCTYTWQGKQVSKSATTDEEGNFSIPGIPFGVTVKVTARGETKTVTCTAQQPVAGVMFGWGGPKIKIETGK